MKRNINTRASALATLAMLALSGTLLAQEPIKPRLRPAEPKPAAEEAAKSKEEGGIRGGEKPAAPAPAPVPAAPVPKEPAAPRAEEIRKMKEEAAGGDREKPAPAEGKPVKAPLFPPGGGIPTIKGDKKDPGEPGIINGEPVKGGDNKERREPGVKEGGGPKGEMKPEGVRRVDGPAVVKPADSEKSAAEPVKNPLAADFEASAKRKYDSLDHHDLSLAEFMKIEREDAERIDALKRNPNARYTVKSVQINGQSACGNGDFEPNGLKLQEWTGGFGQVNPNTGEPDYSNFTSGVLPGALGNSAARHTTTNTGIDPNVGIQQTGPDINTQLPSSHAVRIGNAVNGAGAELLSKTFTVTQSEAIIRFWYAVVLQNPSPTSHTLIQQPAFQVRVVSNGVVIPGLVDLGNGTGKLISDSTNPFFKTKMLGNEPLVYKDWSCAQIDLSTMVGKTVTVQFVTQDCTKGGHWGYAYIDNICGKCTKSPTGDIQFDAAKSSKCGPGNICFTYSLPKDGNSTGTGVIALNLFQAGNLTPVATLTSPSLTAGTSYCFAVNPSTIAGLNASLGGFDFSATGTFTLGTNVTKLTVEGGVVGKNNDYQIACPKPVDADPCCPNSGKNLFPNGAMDIGGGDFGSRYEFVTAGQPTPILPGRVTLTKVEAIEKICSVWQLPPACKKAKDFSGGVMVVNGLTNQPAGQNTAIVQEKIDLPKPDAGEVAEYRVCFRYLPLPSCCFNVTPKLTVVVKKPDGTPIAMTNVSDAPTGCGNLYSASFKAPQGVVIFEILLAEDAKGDGNDLLIDNVTIQQLPAVPSTVRLFNLNAVDLNNGNYKITLTAPVGLMNPPYNWAWEAWDTATNTLAAAVVGGNATSTDFGNMNFLGSKQYLFKLKVWSPCHSLSGSKQTWSFTPNALRIQQQPELDQNPEPVKAAK